MFEFWVRILGRILAACFNRFISGTFGAGLAASEDAENICSSVPAFTACCSALLPCLALHLHPKPLCFEVLSSTGPKSYLSTSKSREEILVLRQRVRLLLAAKHMGKDRHLKLVVSKLNQPAASVDEAKSTSFTLTGDSSRCCRRTRSEPSFSSAKGHCIHFSCLA